MPEAGHSFLAKLLPKLPLWNRIQTRRGALTLLALLLIAGCLGWYRNEIPPVVQVGLWGIVLVVFAFIVRRGWITFFGPVFFYDVIRSTRRSNFALLRSFYAGALLVVLFLVYSSMVRTQASSFWETLWQPATVPVKSLARFGEAFFYTFVAVQFVAVLLLTPVCAAGAITEEKERRTLEYVLASDLTDREVIVGKLAARMAYLVLFMLTGLPVLSLLQFVGGVSPNLLLASFVMTGMTMMSLACLSIAISVFSNKTRGAVFFTYMATVLYLLLSSCCCALPLSWLTAGNFVIAVRRLFEPGASVEDNLLGVFIEYSSFHVVAAVACCIWAALNLRVRSEKQPANMVVSTREPVFVVEARRPAPRLEPGGTPDTSEDTPHLPRRRRVHYAQIDPPAKPRPKVSEQPVLWKELYAEPMVRPGPGGQALIMVFGVMGLLMGGYVLLLSLAAAVSADSAGVFTNWLVRYPGTGLACLMLLGVGIRAAGTLTSERDRQTLDGLLITLLENRSILFGKWLGSILGVRKVWLILGLIWALALVSGGLHPLALLLLLIGWCIFAAFEASLGMWLSLISRSTLVASVATVLTTLALCGGPWGIWSLYVSAMYQGRTPADLVWIEQFLLYGLTPPVSLGVLSFRFDDFESKSYMLSWQIVTYSISGLGCYAVVAAALWRALVYRFPRVTGRMPVGLTGVAPPGETARET